jgi:fructose 1,6-bisphosphate aldolase/phosphatase
VAARAIGGYPGHARVHPKVLERAARMLREQVKMGTIADSGIIHCGDQFGLILTGDEMPEDLIEQAFAAGQNEATDLHLCAAGNTRTVELTLSERDHEPVLVLLTDAGGAVAQILYRVFADPLLTTRLVNDPLLGEGFVFELTARSGVQHRFATPEQSYRLLRCLADEEMTGIRVLQRDGTPAAAASMDRVGGSIIIRTEVAFPSVDEVLALFLSPQLMAGMALMPVSICDAHNTTSAGPSRVTAFGFAINRGRLIGPADLFDDPAFDQAREAAVLMAEHRRMQGPFQP